MSKEIINTSDVNNDVECPFCGEKDFDLIGLKYHLSILAVAILLREAVMNNNNAKILTKIYDQQ